MKMVLAVIDSIAVGLVEYAVPGATPKNPASGLIAYSLPSAAGLIQAMSSPTVVTFQPSSANAGGGTSMAKFVLPQALGKGRGDVGLVALRVGDAHDQHVLGEPALVAGHRRGDAQGEALLAEQGVAAVAAAVAPDRALLGEVHDVLVLGVARPRHVLVPGASGTPTVCMHGTNGRSVPSTSTAARPIRVMIFMFTATYAESVISTPSWAISEPSGPMLKGTTYIVRPGMQPSNSPCRIPFISAGFHPVVGRAGVVPALRADERAVLDTGDVARIGAGEEAVRAQFLVRA